MKLAVNGGHTPTGQGACGILNEVEEDRKIKNALIKELIVRGHQVTDCTADDWMVYPEELRTQVKRANASGAELGISIHLNAGGGTGVEVLYHPASAGGAGESHAAKISAALAKLMGIPNRGAKKRDNLMWLNSTDMTAILIEVCFVDSRVDVDAYRAVGVEAVAQTIADCVVGGASNDGVVTSPTLSISPSKPSTSSDMAFKYRSYAGGRWLGECTNLWNAYGDGFSGVGKGTPIRGLSIGCTHGHLKYRVHVRNRGWLGWITKYDHNDYKTGMAGDLKNDITAVQVYWWSPNGDKYAKYMVLVDNGWYDWQYDMQTTNGQDGYAGDKSKSVYGFRLTVS